MGGVRCAKEIIDSGFAMFRAFFCMVTSIHLNAIRGKEPSYASRDKVLPMMEELTKAFMDIEKEVQQD
jgi:hypothetical protein